MPEPPRDCLLCRPADADRFFGRTRVWSDGLWRLAVVDHGPVVGFAHLEPLRHIPHVSDLDGPEADTFGPVLARVTRVLQAVGGADLVYAYVFGERVAHFHVNLAPHHDGDALLGGPAMLAPDAVDAPDDDHRVAIAAIAAGLRRGDPFRVPGGAK